MPETEHQPPEQATLPLNSPVNPQAELVDPKLIDRALKKIQGLIRGNGGTPEDVTLISHDVTTYPFQARTFLKLAPLYGIRTETGRNTKAELVASEELFNKELQNTIIKARTEPQKRQHIVDFVFQRPDKGFGMRAQRTTFKNLERNLVMHQGCTTCKTTGKTICAKCYGHGMLTCITCQGRRQTVCPTCRGTGHIHAQSGHSQCPKCRGDGRISCLTCHGQGKIRCKSCAATGQLNCTKCAGTGWLSHFAHVEIEAVMDFDFRKDVLPHDLAKIIEAHSTRLVEKGDIEVVLAAPPPVTPAPSTNMINTAGEPDDMIFIDYKAKIPYGPILFKIKDRPVGGTLLGFHGKVLDTPNFLDDLTKKGQKALFDAGLGRGDIVEKLTRAAKYKMLQEVILQASLNKSRSKAKTIVLAKYSTGTDPQRIEKLILAADAALRSLTRRPRYVGLAVGMALTAISDGLYFFSGIGLIEHPSFALSFGTGILVIGLGALMGIISGQTAAYFVQKKLFANLAPEKNPKNPQKTSQKTPLPKLGNLLGLALASSATLYIFFLLAAMIGGHGLPSWAASLHL